MNEVPELDVRRSDDAPRILHVTNVDGGGVVDAILKYVRTYPSASHFAAARSEAAVDQLAGSVRKCLLMPGSPLLARRALGRYVRELEIDLVHAHSSWAGLAARSASLGAPIVYQPHSFYFDNPQLSGPARLLYRTAERVLAYRTDAFAVLTEHEAELCEQLRPAVPRFRLHNVSRYSDVKHPSSVSPRHPETIVTSGRIAEQKDPRLFAEIAEFSQRDGHQFVWIGDGDRALRGALESAGVHVTGWLGEKAMFEVLSKARLYVHTASYEGFPLSILDAAEAGLPVLIRRADYARGSGLLTFDGREEAVAGIDRILTDSTVRERALHASRRLAERHTEPALSEDLDRLYGFATSRRKPKR